ncbi:G protein-activated inward rectifier potassium channel 3-like [Diorhabda sublineata]|uniref:G protein-activated inward rectifier potassium channel 3-like n=1 Tax=Diorhabda sublineata TaxID=1163346 RepID=UPI0024E0F028|nr:G protein-activated inward rectifier potassium channel 3-like [Diorhabda sublineata]
MFGGFKKGSQQIKNKRSKPLTPKNLSTQRKPRAILKDGKCNIIQPKFRWRYLHYVRDIFTGLVDAEWKWMVQVMIIGFTASWLTFALLWWLIAFVHKDLHDDHLPAKQAENGWTPCVLNIHGFHSCFLYSLETQSTMGYGLRAITEECPEAIFLLCAQCIIGTCIDSFTVGVFFAKLTRPRLTAYTVQFSKNAVICLRDGAYCLMFRIGDIRKSRLIGVSVRALVIHSITTKEGEQLTNYHNELEVTCDETGSEPFLLWPITVVHKIDEDSPLYNYSAKDMLNEKIELIVILDGCIESTGQNTHAKTSYLENEILWGQQFVNVTTFNCDNESYEVNFNYFEKMRRIPMPICSAAEFDQNNETLEKIMYPSQNNEESGIMKRSKSSRNIITNEVDPQDSDKKQIIHFKEERSQTPPFPIDWV